MRNRMLAMCFAAAAVAVGVPTTALAQAPYYENCDAVRAAGQAPLLTGEPGYRPGLDRDGDGIACETGGGGGGGGGGQETTTTTAAPTTPPPAGGAPTTRATAPTTKKTPAPVKVSPKYTG